MARGAGRWREGCWDWLGASHVTRCSGWWAEAGWMGHMLEDAWQQPDNVRDEGTSKEGSIMDDEVTKMSTMHILRFITAGNAPLLYSQQLITPHCLLHHHSEASSYASILLLPSLGHSWQPLIYLFPVAGVRHCQGSARGHLTIVLSVDGLVSSCIMSANCYTPCWFYSSWCICLLLCITGGWPLLTCNIAINRLYTLYLVCTFPTWQLFMDPVQGNLQTFCKWLIKVSIEIPYVPVFMLLRRHTLLRTKGSDWFYKESWCFT